MNLSRILKRAGSAVVREAIPGGGLVLDLVNAFLPDDKQLPKDATGDQVQSTVATLPPEQQSLLLAKELDVEIIEINAFAAVQESLARADTAGNSTRPEIAKMMALVVCFAVVVFASAWVVALYAKPAAMADLANSWPVMLAVLATPTALLRSYFGMRTKEKTTRYGLAAGKEMPETSLAAIAGTLFGRRA